MTIVALAIMFVLVFTVFLAALKEHGIFGRSSRFVISFCMASLSVLGLYRGFSGGETRATPVVNETDTTINGTVQGILLLYAAFAIACVLLIVAIIAMWLKGRRRRRTENTISGSTTEELTKRTFNYLRRRGG